MSSHDAPPTDEPPPYSEMAEGGNVSVDAGAGVANIRHNSVQTTRPSTLAPPPTLQHPGAAVSPSNASVHSSAPSESAASVASSSATSYPPSNASSQPAGFEKSRPQEYSRPAHAPPSHPPPSHSHVDHRPPPGPPPSHSGPSSSSSYQKPQPQQSHQQPYQQQQHYHNHHYNQPPPPPPQQHGPIPNSNPHLRYPKGYWCSKCHNTGTKVKKGTTCKDCYERFGVRTQPTMLPPGAMPMFNMPPRVVMPGDPSIGGALCGRCRGSGVVHEMLFFEDTCPVCHGVGRVF